MRTKVAGACAPRHLRLVLPDDHENPNGEPSHRSGRLCIATKTAASIDRALRSSDWELSGKYRTFADRQSGIALRCPVGANTTFDPPGRLADVFRVLSAAAMAEWPQGKARPEACLIESRAIVDALYAVPTAKGMRSDNVLAVDAHMQLLNQLTVCLPAGMDLFPSDGRAAGYNNRATRSALSSPRSFRLLEASPRGRTRMIGKQLVHVDWNVRAGEWMALSRRSFVLVPNALIRLGTRHLADRWTKSIGMELCFHYREDRRRGAQKVLRVGGLLDRAGLMADVERKRASRNAVECRELFEHALDQLVEFGLIVDWQYRGGEPVVPVLHRRQWLPDWLDAYIEWTPPAAYVKPPSPPRRR